MSIRGYPVTLHGAVPAAIGISSRVERKVYLILSSDIEFHLWIIKQFETIQSKRYCLTSGKYHQCLPCGMVSFILLYRVGISYGCRGTSQIFNSFIRASEAARCCSFRTLSCVKIWGVIVLYMLLENKYLTIKYIRWFHDFFEIVLKYRTFKYKNWDLSWTLLTINVRLMSMILMKQFYHL